MFRLQNYILSLCAWALLSVLPLQAQTGPIVTAGGMTREVCTDSTFLVTPSSAYTSGNQVGTLIAFNPAYRSTSQGAPDNGGITQSIRLNIKSTQTATFKAYQFASNPSGTTWTDKTTPNISSADGLKVRAPISLSSPDSGLGTNTIYGTDAIARISVGANQIDYWIIVVVGTPTFSTTSDVQFCATYLLD